MTLASEVITRGLRLINVPGRGKALSGQDSADAFETLTDIISAESVSKMFVPGIRRHFFALTPNKAIYTYGPGGELDTNQFTDLTPIHVEDAYIREGATIQQNQQVSDGDFLVSTNWTLGTGWTVANGVATIAAGNAGETLSQVLGLTAGRIYTVKVDITHRAGSVTFRVIQDGVTNIVNQVLAGTGSFEFQTTFSGVTSSSVSVLAAADSDLDVDNISIIETGLDEVTLPDPAASGGSGSDYNIKIINQKRYNRRFTKGTGGRPYEILFSRDYPIGSIRFDNASIQGDILVMDVLAAPQVSALSSTVPLHPEAIKWLKYQLAREMAPEYGKELKRSQERTLLDARQKLFAGTNRKNTLRADRALRGRPIFDINRGDP